MKHFVKTFFFFLQKCVHDKFAQVLLHVSAACRRHQIRSIKSQIVSNFTTKLIMKYDPCNLLKYVYVYTYTRRNSYKQNAVCKNSFDMPDRSFIHFL
jgi:hypothetical protein